MESNQQTPKRRTTSIDSTSSPKNSPGQHVIRMFGKLSKPKKDSLRMPKDGSFGSSASINSANDKADGSSSIGGRLKPKPVRLTKKSEDSLSSSLTRPTPATASPQRETYTEADSAFLRAVRGETPQQPSRIEKKTSFDDSVTDMSMNEADSAFLRSFRGEDSSSTSIAMAQAPEGDGIKPNMTLNSMDSSTNKLLPPIDEMAHANAAFLGALHASSVNEQESSRPKNGTFVFDQMSGQTSSSGQSEAFLTAMRNSSNRSSDWSSSNTLILKDGIGADTNNGGTFIFKEKKVGTTDEANPKQSFLMALSNTNDLEPKEEDTADSSEEEDDTGSTDVPSYPYIEKVMLPRPLFFGHTLPPRVMKEAEKAAKLYVNHAKRNDDSIEEDTDSSLKDIDDVTKSTTSTFSTNVGGGKLFESEFLPCAKNLEGALDTFGFGVNPFHLSTEYDGDHMKETDLSIPHPYVSMYAPVWGDRARMDRARSKRRREKKLAEASTQAADTAPNLMGEGTSNYSSDGGMYPFTCGSDDGSVDFKETKMPISSTTEEANNAFLSQLRSGSPEMEEIDKDGSNDNKDFSRDQFAMFARGESSPVQAPVEEKVEQPVTDLSSRDQFLMFARGDDTGGTFIGSPVIDKKGGTFVCSKSFAVGEGVDGSDDDSIEAAEERKTVGWNDNMAAAAAMLAGKEMDIDGDENDHGIGMPLYGLAAGGGAKAANRFGRPYSNLELTGGCVPRFSCDDPSLPHESDLGVFETKEDEKRTNEQRREKNIIQDVTVPGIMPLVVRPTPCTDADDSQSWNSRAAANESAGTRKASNTVIISLDDNANLPTGLGPSPHKTPQTYEASRVGWWNLPDGFDEISATYGKSKASKKQTNGSSPLVEVFPATDDPIPLDVITNLWPTPQVLRDNNISAAQLHSATSSARLMPHLSDRSANRRHLQIDTTAVGFPKLGGEVEPMFCKLAIYHFEMNAMGSSVDKNICDSVSSTISSSGISVNSHPSRDRCGPVTEALNFDVVQDPKVIENCKRALWPYASENDLDKLPGAIGSNDVDHDVILEGSPCGVFPLPSHLHISNLYAVLLVHNVVSDSVDQHPYFKPSRRDKTSVSNQKEDIDLTKLRESASKSSDSYGQLITPIAFGVLPLVQIVGNEESPKVPVTRVVQIPLFKFEQGRGTDVILDHILGMLHPRAVPKVGKIASMTRGHAFLVMRYYGYLGLHSIISKIKMARNRLVDFSRELQVKREEDAKSKKSDKCPNIGNPYILPQWRRQYVVEPAPYGGRQISVQTPSKSPDIANGSSTTGYAQELAALPLENSGVEVKSSSRRSNRSATSHKFDCMLLHTSFCNELICHPRILTRCSKKNVTIKIELREIEWNDSLKAYAAIPIEPSIHNPRRGPWLVDEAFTSCALKSANPQFLDEFKIKLPLILGDSGRTVALYFSVYEVHVQKRRKERLMKAMSRQNNQHGTDADNVLELIGNGVLSLSSDESPLCLLSNGEHKVPMNYRVLDIGEFAGLTTLSLPSTKQHKPKNSTSSIGSVVRHLKSLSWTNEDVAPSFSIDTVSTDDELHTQQREIVLENLNYPAGTLFLERVDETNIDSSDIPDNHSVKSDTDLINNHRSTKSDIIGDHLQDSLEQTGGMKTSMSSGNLQQLGSAKIPEDVSNTTQESFQKDELILKVNVVAFSSVHPQNKTLADLFMLKPDRPRCVTTGDFSGLSPWGKHRSEILYRLKPERIPPFNFVGGALAETERKLLEPVVCLSKTSKCPAFDVIPHLFRIISQLLRTMTCGIGEPSILWAAPDALIPLRLNAFASLLHVVSSTSHHMAKTGLRLLDGDTKWNISVLSKTLSLLFDEFKLFGGPLEEFAHISSATESANQEKSSPKDFKGSSPDLLSKKPLKLARSKTSNERGVTPKPMIIERFSSEETKPPSFDVDAMLQSSNINELSEEKNPPNSSRASGLKVDTRNDFMSALREAAANENGSESGDNQISNHLISSLGSMSSGGAAASRRRFFTLPAMATIQESDTEENRPGDSSLISQSSKLPENKGELDSELILHRDRPKPKQFRVPQLIPKAADVSSSTDGISSFLDSLSQPPPLIGKEAIDTTQSGITTNSSKLSIQQTTLPANDDVIETAGTAFLDKISETIDMGFLNSTGKTLGGEERRVGAAHHRKTRSRCSIDWTLPPTDMLLEKDQQIEQQNRTKASAATSPIVGLSPALDSFLDDTSSGEETSFNDKKEESNNLEAVHPLKQQRAESESRSKHISVDPTALPDFADRMGTMKDEGRPLRWWPYVYEVIIYQWLTLLSEQTRKSDSALKASAYSKPKLSPIVTKYLSHAAKAARGATIRCAPYLLEIIKQSLGWRIDVMFRNGKARNERADVPQLVKLDANILTALEKLITLLTDASIDSRNFDSFEFRRISIDVNDAVVKFLRDLFAMLDVVSVHRLVMVYFSRFVTKDGKHWHDRDSKTTGLRCSWETTKLRLNAVTLFIRFSDFMKVNMPLMERENWESCTLDKSIETSRRFYTNVLERMTRLGMNEITSPEGPISKKEPTIPTLRSHWLAELCTDICLGATGHAEESIQQRASSLLFELFWTISQEGRASGNISIFASVFVPFIPKVLAHTEYLSSLPGKSQLRKDIIPCILLVLQSAPVGVMRALWRKLSKQAEGKAQQDPGKYGGISGAESQIHLCEIASENTLGTDGMHDDLPPDIYDMFGLLNLSLSTIEYDGCETSYESEENHSWKKEFLLSADKGREQMITSMNPRILPLKNDSGNGCAVDDDVEQDTTLNSRRWHAHDCSMIIIHTCRQIVRETLSMLKPINNETDFNESDPTSLDFQQGSLSYDELLLLSKSKSSSLDNVDSTHLLNSITGDKRTTRKARRIKRETLSFEFCDNVIFVRAATSVYLHALTMRQSDIVIVKTLIAAIEIVKIFGVKVFLNAVGETLQHWIRVTLEHCGARRAEVRVEASEFLNLLLRLTWDSYGSFFRIRLPLLAVQTEVMERIVAKATSKYEREQKSLRLQPVKFSTDNAEASLTPLWRTIDRIHFQSASLNLSFKSALARLAIMMKKLFKAYLAVHALNSLTQSELTDDAGKHEPNPYAQKMRISVHRIVSNAAGYSRQLVGNQAATHLGLSSIQSETIEDSLFNAADVFSSSELPSHRFAFLEKLAEFHRLRSRFAEEATCRLHIYHTYHEAAKQHSHIWSSSPFLPWASSQTDQSGLDEPTGEGIMNGIDYENLSVTSGKYLESNPSFRKIFYRAADSVMVRTGDWGGFGGKFLFYGVALKSEFSSTTPWFTLRQMEETMAEEAELAGELFLRSGIVESSRHAWNIATYIYSESFNYARLARAYGRLALVVTSKIPAVDTSNQFDMSSQIGRFYKVYFHGGAPDDLLHAQGSEGFVYRIPSCFSIKDFASRLETSIRSILPAKSRIDILLDDGSPVVPKTSGKRGSALGGVTSEPIKIKVTPLRPLFKMEDSEKCFRGTPEWFQMKTDEYDNMIEAEASGGMFLHQRQISSSSGGNTLSSSGSMSMSNRRTSLLSNFRPSKVQSSFYANVDKDTTRAETIGVDRFYFTQPARRDPNRGFKDWLKVPTGSFAERSLRVTELQVESNFPACVTRQKIIHRAIFTQSPLEAGVEAVSTWCSLLFRTIMATNGLRVLSEIDEQEDGHNIICVAKVLADCIHSSGVKQIGLSFLSVNSNSLKPNSESGYYSAYECLSEEEIEKVQTKLARIIVTFLELLHLLIAKNRHVILAAVQARKRRGADGVSTASGSGSRAGIYNSPLKYEEGQDSDISSLSQLKLGGDTILGKSITTTKTSGSHKANASDRTDAAIGVQSELQRGFISLIRALSPNLLDTINTEVPRWMRQCCQENYFSSGLYRQADIPIGDELFFNIDEERGSKDDSSVPASINRGHSYHRSGSSPGNSLSETEISDGRRSSETKSRHRETAGSSFSSLLGNDKIRY